MAGWLVLLLLYTGPAAEGDNGGRTSGVGGTAELRLEFDAEFNEYLDNECNGSSLSEADEIMELALDDECPDGVAAAADTLLEYGNPDSSSWRGRLVALLLALLVPVAVVPGPLWFDSGVCGSTE